MERQHRTSSIFIFIILLLALALASCNVPVPTSTSQPGNNPTPTRTQSTSPILPTATLTPNGDDLLPTATALTLTPAGDCARVQFITDVTYPDDTDVDAEETITKTWRVKNTGTCPWDSNYKLVFIRGEQMEGDSPAEIITSPIAPGDMAEISIELTMPDVNGAHWGIWQIVDGAGDPIKKANGEPQELSIFINVENGTGGRVTSVQTVSYFFYGVKCTNNVEYDMTMRINTDGPVSVAYTWSVTNGVLTVVSENHVFADAGSIEVTTHIAPPFADPNNVRVTLTANGVSASYSICP